MKIKVIACKVMLRQLYALAAESENVVDILWMRQELHAEPDNMRAWLQHTIDRIEAEETPYDAIVLAYGLCSNGTAGLRASKTRLVIARAHDCITLLLGSKSTYAKLFEADSGGIYWYSQGWLESADMPGRERYETLYAEYCEKYGQDNAQYLLEMEQSWMRNYHKAVYISWPHEDEKGAEHTHAQAEFLNWTFERVLGDPSLLRDLIGGRWDEERFLVLEPGAPVAAAYDGGIVRAGKA